MVGSASDRMQHMDRIRMEVCSMKLVAEQHKQKHYRIFILRSGRLID